MRQRSYRKHIVAALLAAISLLLIVTAILLRERKYEGKTAREWIYLLDPHVDHRDQHDHASEVLVRIGPATIPTIRDILQEPKFKPLQKLKILAQRYRLLPPDPLEIGERQYRASRAAYKIAEGADVDISSLVPLLAYHLTNSPNYSGTETGRALAGAGPAGIAILTNLASDPRPNIRDRAVVSLQHARSKPGVFETYLRTINDPDQDIRFVALSSLARYPDADPNLIVPLALHRIQSTNSYDRWAATKVFAAFPSHPGSLPALTNALSDPDPTVRSTATRALKRLQKEP